MLTWNDLETERGSRSDENEDGLGKRQILAVTSVWDRVLGVGNQVGMGEREAHAIRPLVGYDLDGKSILLSFVSYLTLRYLVRYPWTRL